MSFSFKDHELTYGPKTVLKNLHLHIQPGEHVAIIGESGVGKSTLLKALREQQASTSAWCPQQPGLVPMLSCLHNIYMGRLDQYNFLINLKQLLYPSAKIRTEIASIAIKLGLEHELQQAAEQLSGGQQQRCSIGRGLFSKKSILIADEPVSALDEFQALKVLDVMKHHFETMVIAFHDIHFARHSCKRMIALKNGGLYFDKQIDTVTDDELKEVYRST